MTVISAGARASAPHGFELAEAGADNSPLLGLPNIALD
jgi:hypothetical protein